MIRLYLAAVQLIDPDNVLPQSKANSTTIKTFLTDFFVALGAIAVLMIMIAGVRYVFARGNAEKTTQAKNIIQYSIIGLIIAALASSIVQIVLDRAS